MKKLPAYLVASLLKVLHKAQRQAEDPVQRTILSILERQISRFGEEAIRNTGDAIKRLFDGLEVGLSELTDDLWLASDIVSSLQVLEASQRRKARDWFVALMQEIQTLLTRE